jgi:hypothetical protein
MFFTLKSSILVISGYLRTVQVAPGHPVMPCESLGKSLQTCLSQDKSGFPDACRRQALCPYQSWSYHSQSMVPGGHQGTILMISMTRHSPLSWLVANHLYLWVLAMFKAHPVNCLVLLLTALIPASLATITARNG